MCSISPDPFPNPIRLKQTPFFSFSFSRALWMQLSAGVRPWLYLIIQWGHRSRGNPLGNAPPLCPMDRFYTCSMRSTSGCIRPDLTIAGWEEHFLFIFKLLGFLNMKTIASAGICTGLSVSHASIDLCVICLVLGTREALIHVWLPWPIDVLFQD